MKTGVWRKSIYHIAFLRQLSLYKFAKMEDHPDPVPVLEALDIKEPEKKLKTKKSKKKKKPRSRQVAPGGDESDEAIGGDRSSLRTQLVLDNPEFSLFDEKEKEKDPDPIPQKDPKIYSYPVGKDSEIEVIRSSSMTSPSTGLYVVVPTVILSLVLGIIAVVLESHVYSLDQKWNKIIAGEIHIEDTKQYGFFAGRTFSFGKHHHYLQKAMDYAKRDESQEVLFMILLSVYMALELLHLFAYTRFINIELSSMKLTLFYGFGGALCMYSSTFLVSAAIAIEDNYIYVVDMFYNFQHMLDDFPPLDPRDGRCRIKGEWYSGCSSYEKSKSYLSQLERVFQACGDGYRNMRYYDEDLQTVTLGKHVYSRQELKIIGLCSRDGFKFAAALFAVLMGLVCSMVPVIYCCCATRTALDKKPSVEVLKNYSAYVNFDPEKAIPSVPTPSSEQEATRRFREYVEKESDEDEKYAKLYPRKVFKFMSPHRD